MIYFYKHFVVTTTCIYKELSYMYFYQIKTRETYCDQMSSKCKTPDFDGMPILGLYEIYMYVLSIYFQLQNNVKNFS